MRTILIKNKTCACEDGQHDDCDGWILTTIQSTTLPEGAHLLRNTGNMVEIPCGCSCHEGSEDADDIS